MQHQRSHAGPPVMAGHAHAVNGDGIQTGEIPQRIGHLGGGDVLALPAEGVANTVDKPAVAVGITAQHVARRPPGIALLKDVAQDFLLGGLHGGVALKPARHNVGVVVNHANGLARLINVRKLHETVFVKRMAFGFNVVAHQAQIGLVPKGYTAAGTNAVVQIDGAGVGFGRTPTLKNLGLTKALHPLVPDLGGHARAGHFAQGVVFILWGGRRAEQKAANLAHILAHGDTITSHVAPELTPTELAPHHQARPCCQGGGGGRHGGCTVVQRQKAINAVVRLDLPDRLHAGTGHQPACMADDGRFGQAGGAGGKHVLGGITRHQTGAPFQRRVVLRCRLCQRRQIERAQGALPGCRGILGVGPEPAAQVGRQVRGGCKMGQAFFADDDGFGAQHINGMGQQFAADMGVEECHHGTQLAQAHPDKEKCGPILHGQGHGVAFPDTQCMRRMGHLVDSLIELLVAPQLVAVENAGPLTEGQRPRLNTFGGGIRL